MNTETRFYFLLSFDESYSLYATNATGFKNNIRAETALCSGTTDNLQTFLKYPFPFHCQSLSLMQASQLKHFYSWIITQGKLTLNFSWETAAYILLNMSYYCQSFSGIDIPLFFPLNAHSLIQFCFLCFEADVWSSTFGSKAHEIFLPLWCGVF